MAVRITCIKKDDGNHQNPHEGITHYGWFNESTNERGIGTRAGMVNFLEKGGEAYVKDYYGNIAYCFVNESANGIKFLQTHSDKTPTDNLLELPEC